MKQWRKAFAQAHSQINMWRQTYRRRLRRSTAHACELPAHGAPHYLLAYLLLPTIPPPPPPATCFYALPCLPDFLYASLMDCCCWVGINNLTVANNRWNLPRSPPPPLSHDATRRGHHSNLLPSCCATIRSGLRCTTLRWDALADDWCITYVDNFSIPGEYSCLRYYNSTLAYLQRRCAIWP